MTDQTIEKIILWMNKLITELEQTVNQPFLLQIKGFLENQIQPFTITFDVTSADKKITDRTNIPAKLLNEILWRTGHLPMFYDNAEYEKRFLSLSLKALQIELKSLQLTQTSSSATSSPISANNLIFTTPKALFITQPSPSFLFHHSHWSNSAIKPTNALKTLKSQNTSKNTSTISLSQNPMSSRLSLADKRWFQRV